MSLDNYTAQGVEIIKDEKVPFGCIRLHWVKENEFGEEYSGYTDLIVSQDSEISKISREPFLIIDDEDGSNPESTDLVQQLLASLADKIVKK